MESLQSKVREIQRDVTLSQDEKKEKIKELLQSIQEVKIIPSLVPVCTHYNRGCNIISSCCNKEFGCRLCHDEVNDHKINRFATKIIVCKKCNLKQDITNKCRNCDIEFGKYFCEICRLWTNCDEEIFHCEHCGICIKAEKNEVVHCHTCGTCIYKNADKHHCQVISKKENCIICNEQLWLSHQKSTVLNCSHSFHTSCLNTWLKTDYRCPLCKKSVVKINWTELKLQIINQPMPESLRKKVNILCNDCLEKSQVQLHYLGNQCPMCESFNTTID